MSNLVRSRLALATAALGALSLLAVLRAEDPPKPQAEKPAPVVKNDGPAKMGFAVEPKPLSDAVKKGLKYLVNQQQLNGGWGQGGGWRTNLDPQAGGGRVEGPEVADPPDVGNTCVALLALIRAGNTPTEGPYAKNVAKGLDFIMGKVEASDKESLFVTDVKGTQIQSKIGPYVDTFLTAMVLAELKGKTGDRKIEERLVACANKTIGKMEKHQKKDGTFADNHAWASVLSQGLANKSFNYAAQKGIAVANGTIRRVQEQVAGNFDANTGTFRTSGAAAIRGAIAARPGAPTATEAAPSDAGVQLYAASSNLTNAADVVRSGRIELKKLEKIVADAKASKEEKDLARDRLKAIKEAEELNDRATAAVVKQLDNPAFVQGFGTNGGEEFLSFLNISETLLLKGGDEWKKWDKAISESLTRVQNQDGSWSGHHCITGKTFCTAGALLVLMADRTPFPLEALAAKEGGKKEEKK
ncbi:MAG TPA: prenyltransferase/squalene oxidase repeat-containing protein [Gemmataceae bacterium]